MASNMIEQHEKQSPDDTKVFTTTCEGVGPDGPFRGIVTFRFASDEITMSAECEKAGPDGKPIPFTVGGVFARFR